MTLICIKQHLSKIWSSIQEKVKQHWGWVEKSAAYKKLRRRRTLIKTKSCGEIRWYRQSRIPKSSHSDILKEIIYYIGILALLFILLSGVFRTL